MRRDIGLWKRVIGDFGLLDRAAAIDPTDVAAVASLRDHVSADEAEVALTIAASRRRAKATGKFGAAAAFLAADRAAVEQASGNRIAELKAARIRARMPEGGTLADLCCGAGGDTLFLANANARYSVVAVDHDPLRAWMARENSCGWATAVCADIRDLALDGVAIHIDPARRDAKTGRRVWRLEDYQPGPDVFGPMIERAPAAAVKLSPSVDPDRLPWPGQIEYISHNRRVAQAMLWTGWFAHPCHRTATVVTGSGVFSISGEHGPPFVGPVCRYLYAIDPAIERAELIGHLSDQVAARAIHPRLGLLTSDRIIDSPCLTGFELIERMPWRPRRVRQWLAANDGGLVEVKTRGKACDPDVEQRRLRGDGATTYTLFVLRFDTKVQALITRRLTRAD